MPDDAPMPAPPLPGPRPTVVRVVAAALNGFLLTCSVALLAFAFLAALSPPAADVSPQPVSSYPQYLLTLLLVACFGCSLFFVSLLGLVALCFFNSFLIFLHTLGQLAVIAGQLVAVAFTLTVRKRLHYKVEESWIERGVCHEGLACAPLDRFRSSELFLIVLFCVFLFSQIVLLIMSAFLAEKQSYEERYEQLRTKADDDDE